MNLSFSEMFQATIAMYLDCARAATTGLIKNWKILPGVLALLVLFYFAAMIFGGMGIAGGFILGIIQIIMISYYYLWLDEIVSRNALTFQDMKEFDSGMFFRVLNILFVLFIINFLFIGVRHTSPNLIICIEFLLVILLNAAPELVYINKYDGFSAITESVGFIKNNWIEWFVPFLVMASPVLLFIPLQAFLLFMARGVIMIPGFSIATVWLIFDYWISLYIAVPLAVIAGNWFMLFRGFLFKELVSGSRRQRAFRSRVR